MNVFFVFGVVGIDENFVWFELFNLFCQKFVEFWVVYGFYFFKLFFIKEFFKLFKSVYDIVFRGDVLMY